MTLAWCILGIYTEAVLERVGLVAVSPSALVRGDAVGACAAVVAALSLSLVVVSPL